MIDKVPKPDRPEPQYYVATDFAPKPPNPPVPYTYRVPSMEVAAIEDATSLAEILSLCVQSSVIGQSIRGQLSSVLEDSRRLLSSVTIEPSYSAQVLYTFQEWEREQRADEYKRLRAEWEVKNDLYQKAQEEADRRNLETLLLRAQWREYWSYVEDVYRTHQNWTTLCQEVKEIERRLSDSSIDSMETTWGSVATMRERLSAALPDIVRQRDRAAEKLSGHTLQDLSLLCAEYSRRKERISKEIRSPGN
tara:strand:- start:286 stop:1032 length:747 start_codon:yes stop_codon:yes gene_type:complete